MKLVKLLMVASIMMSSVFAGHAGKQKGSDMHSNETANDVQTLLATLETSLYPQEKVYLHLDNTSYYYGDKIWFKAYVVSANGAVSPGISNTLYVELLNPGGEVIERKVLKVENGQAHGDFTLMRVPFYSGFYEIRAYTKYMLNFGEETAFSRVIPVFEKLKEDGDYDKRELKKYGTGKYEYRRGKIKEGKDINLKFYPEGGNLVKGVPSRVAFEATDRRGHPMDVSGRIVTEKGEERGAFNVSHDGKGVFVFIPDGDKLKAEVELDGKRHKFDLPKAHDTGYVLHVDNLSNPDKVKVRVSRGGLGSELDTLGVALLNQGILRNCAVVVSNFQKPLELGFETGALSPGVSQVVLMDKAGNIIADRLIFCGDANRISIVPKFDKADYAPFSPVRLSVKLLENDTIPVKSPFSISVRDGDREMAWDRNIMTDLLLMSEVKGYISNPGYYFEGMEPSRREHLDQLLMVQGWRRYDWSRILDAERNGLRYPTESNGIKTVGKVTGLSKKKGMPGVEVSAFLMKGNEDNDSIASLAADVFVTDSLGRFSFTTDVQGDWNMVLAVRKNGKSKDGLIFIDRMFSPKLRTYVPTDLELNTADGNMGENSDKETPDSIREEDVVVEWLNEEVTPVTRKGKKEKVKELQGVVVKGNKRSNASDIYKSRSKAYAYYETQSSVDDLRDEGNFVDTGRDLKDYLMKLNRNFYRYSFEGEEYLMYKQRLPLMVTNYERTDVWESLENAKNVRLQAVKGIYVTEDWNTIKRYADPRLTINQLYKIYGCAVLIETYPDDKFVVDGGKGVRKTRLQGYSVPAEFYSPDYSFMSPDPDYRRTLYWNPLVMPDKNGEATIDFYNNGRCKDFIIDIQTITPTGAIGTYVKGHPAVAE